MLRVGLTGDLGSGKSTVAQMLAERGAVVLSSDEMGRVMMQPGEPVYAAIVAKFGETVVQPDGQLNRTELSRIAFAEKRVEELNAIVHPAVIAAQAQQIAELVATKPDAIVVIESALLFTTKYARDTNGNIAPWHKRFDEVLLVTAPEAVKIARFVERGSANKRMTAGSREALEAEARRRLAAQKVSDAETQDCIIVRNNGDLAALETRVNEVWRALQRMAGRKSA